MTRSGPRPSRATVWWVPLSPPSVCSLRPARPAWLTRTIGLSPTAAIQLMFVLYALLAGLAALVYRGLPRALSTDAHQSTAPLTKSKRKVYALAALFSLDAFGGGFVVQSMVALW